MARSYDAAVLGSGTAAYSIATALRGGGMSVALADCRPFGGTCALRGCDPKRVLVGAAEVRDAARRLEGHGLAGEPRLDWAALMAFKRTFTDPVPGETAKSLAERGIEARRGRARFVSPTELAIGGEVLSARYIVLATGAEPAPLGIPGEEHLATNEDFLSLGALPERIALVGGGYIAAEFSHLAARAGARVAIVQNGPRMLKGFDPDLVDDLMESFRAAGIDVRTGASVEAVESKAGAFVVHVARGGRHETVEADLVVHAAGRRPALAALEPERAGVEVRAGRLALNRYLQSESNPAVYAAGDAAQAGPPLTPVAALDARIVAANILEGNHAVPDYRGVPSVAFSIPPIASVGLTEARAREEGLRLRVVSRRAADWFTARRVREPVYGFKVLIEEGTDRIIGAHLAGPGADESINLFALAIRNGLPASAVRDAVFAYPTAGSDVPWML